MTGWVDPDDPTLAAATSLARELADPIRLTALQLLAVEGPHTMTQLADALRVSAPRLGNHLARLRARGLVTVQQRGRHVVYRLASPDTVDVLTALARHGRPETPGPRPARPPSPAETARTCYDHCAGRLGVAVFAALVQRGALLPPDGQHDELRLGPDPTAFGDLGVDLDAVRPGRRKLATACLDRNHRLPHLGGVLGAEVLDAFVADGLVHRQDGERALAITARGARKLPALLPEFPAPAAGGRRP
ncbi:transcriptional regulator [Plantactinospora sp. BC1]|uniref:ArsR/SmtB family transcription factor n=1 Tax=Plantactinospora sp. BC1 TaxID=2108470 RepID=UPI000D170C47|nr:helix-turn-helix transcriptional regulator [Plantactinospora sp. BC1]AVT28992.1 transcriptional regulator [Plantactinospora sp. BC1]